MLGVVRGSELIVEKKHPKNKVFKLFTVANRFDVLLTDDGDEVVATVE